VNGFRKTIRNFFGTTRAQTNGFVGLLLVITLAIFSQPLTRWWVSSQPLDFSKDAAMLDSLTRTWKASEEKQRAELQTEEIAIAYFNFDPNSATQDEFKSLGFSEKLASRIINYRTKGGKYRIKSDIMKLYGMDSVLYRKIVSYIQLPDQLEKPKFEKKEFADRTKPFREKSQKFNLNEADTIQLEKIYGIGPALAKRIVKYRDKLGGFVSEDQLKEVYGLDTTVVKKILEASYLPELPAVKKIHLNTADEKILAAHPYFGRKIASAIVAYRFQHGNFKSVDDLSKIPLIDKNNLGKLFPYATVDP
jgi:competence ComEA-like helix-hairpin-helix protein